MTYEEILIQTENGNIIVLEKDLMFDLKGLYIDGHIIINSKIQTDDEKKCIYAEELGHHMTSYGNILNTNDISSMKQELAARSWGFQYVIPLEKLIDAYKYGVQNTYEAAEYICVPVEYLKNAMERFKQIYGPFVDISEYRLYFVPYIRVEKLSNL